jgi:hypothetical protein
MIPQKQLFRHEPHNNIIGDCHRAALASLLNLQILEVPHFAQLELERPGYDFWGGVRQFLTERGLAAVDHYWDGALFALDDLLNWQEAINPNVYYLLGGLSPRGFPHTVIGLGGEIVLDPHPDNTGVNSPLENGYWHTTYMVPLELTQVAA